MKTKRIAVVTALSVLLLTGCGVADTETGVSTGLEQNTISLKDGRQVTCVVYKAGYAGGLSCDWDNAK